MRAALAVFRDELAARRAFLLLALGIRLSPFAIVALFHPHNASPTDVRGATAAVLAGALGALLAIGFGSSLFGPDLASGRLRYWLTRPVSPTSLWVGKNAAALASILACVGLALLPSALTGDLDGDALERVFISRLPAIPGLYLPTSLFGLALTFVASQALGLLKKARSRWVVLDLVGLIAIGSAIASTASRLFEAGAVAVHLASGVLFGLALLISLGVASLVALRSGRTDLSHTHRAFSLTLWGLLALATSALGASAWTALHPRPERLELDATLAVVPAEAPWFALSGRLDEGSELHGLFACEESAGGCRLLRFDLDSRGTGAGPPFAAANGRALTWLGPSGYDLNRFVAEPSRSQEPAPVALRVDRLPWAAPAFAPDGESFVVLDADRLVLVRTRDGSVLKTIPLPGVGALGFPAAEIRFVDASSILVARSYSRSRSAGSASRFVGVARVDVERGRIDEVGRVESPPFNENTLANFALSLSPQGRFLAVRRWRRDWHANDAEATAIFRVEPGMPHVLAAALATSTSLPTWLPDERTIWTSRSHQLLALHWMEPTSGEVHGVDLPGVAHLIPVAARGSILVASVTAVSDPPRPLGWWDDFDLPASRLSPREWRAVAIDLATGETRTVGEGLRAIPAAYSSAPLGTRPLFVDAEGRVVELDPEKGSRHVWLTAELGSRARE